MCQFQPFYSTSAESECIVIVGAGLAGLFAALKLSERCSWPILLLSPARLGQKNASSWAQGGIAAAVDPNDSIEAHIADTISSGAELNDSQVVQAICQSAVSHIAELEAYGVPFDRSDLGFALSHEAAHSSKRVVRCTGDSSGRMIMKSLMAAVKKQPQITLLEGVEAHTLIQNNNRVCGIIYQNLEQSQFYQLPAGAVILACGGIGALFQATTNPPSALGQGLGMAALAGAVLADNEFIQFHPTALDLPHSIKSAQSPQPLISETLRGEGATLLDANGQRFLLKDSAANGNAELAPRNVVAYAVFRACRDTGAAFLDCRHLCDSSAEFSKRFPTLWQITKLHKLNPKEDLLPIIPAVHYHMGGIATDLRGRSSVPGLWAIGELACTGFHGANRLASNSLLEAVVMANWAALDISANFRPCSNTSIGTIGANTDSHFIGTKIADACQATPPFLSQTLMSAYVGVERSTEGLLYALRQLATQPKNNSLVAAISITCAALLRRESLGSHYYLETNPVLPNKLHNLLGQYHCKGRRSFLTWQIISQILQEAGP